MNDKLKHFLKYDRIFLGLSIISVVVFLVFIYYLGNTHQPNCSYYYLRTAETLFRYVIGVPAVLALYSFIKLGWANLKDTTNLKLLGFILGCALIIFTAACLYAFIGFGLFFGKTCY